MESIFPVNPYQESIFDLLHEEASDNIPLFTDGPEWENSQSLYSKDFVSPQSESPQDTAPLKSYDVGDV